MNKVRSISFDLYLRSILAFTFFVICSVLVAPLYADAIKIHVPLSPAGSFEITSPQISGQVTFDRSTGQFSADRLTVRTNTLKSGIDLRDEHLLERLEARRHRSITVYNARGSQGKGVGEIEIRGVRRPINFTYQNEGSHVQFEFPLSLSEFGITGISYLGVGVSDQITVRGRAPASAR